jgi:Lrp/AsnC family leucine-responsive transcriptional regulator
MPTTLLDALDIRILATLQAHARLTNLELAERVGLSASPCLRRVRRLQEDGFIEGYATRLNREKLGLGILAFVRVNIERHSNTDGNAFINAFIKAVSKLPEVIACYITSGESDFLLQVVVKDFAAYRSFALEKLARVPGVRDLRSTFVIGTVKEGAPLPLPASAGLLSHEVPDLQI